MASVCIDTGGTNTVIGIGEGSFEVVDTFATPVFLQDVPGTIRRVLSENGFSEADVDQAAIAAAGPIDREQGVFYPPNIDMPEINLVSKLAPITDDVTLVNDCHAGVIGEHVYGDASVDNLVYLTISTGIGAGVIADGRLIRGKKGNFGEIGHMVVGNTDLACGCGGTDHWEAYSSGRNVPRMARHLFDHECRDIPDLVAQYRAGDPTAEQVIKTMNTYNARGIANISNVYDPEVIALGGGVALNHADILLDGITEQVTRESINDLPDIQLSTLREKTVLHGLRAITNGVAP